MNSKKNVVEGDISNDGTVISGDKIDYHLPPKIPKELSARIRKIPPNQIVGRENDLNDLHQRLTAHKQVLLVNGLGGIGKTTLAQAYVAKYWDEYHHIAWISQLSEEIINDFVNEGLLENLNIPKVDQAKPCRVGNASFLPTFSPHRAPSIDGGKNAV